MAMRKFLDDAELRRRQGICSSQGTKEVTNEGDAECKEQDSAEDETDKRENSVATGEMPQDSGRRTSGRDLSQIQDEHSQTEVEKEVLRAFRALFNGFEEQWYDAMQQGSVSSESEAEEPQNDPVIQAVKLQSPLNEDLENWISGSGAATLSVR